MSQKNFTLLLFAILFSVFSVLGFILYTGLEETQENKEWEVHSRLVKEKIKDLLSTTYNQESVNRGFVLTLDSVFVLNDKNNEEVILGLLRDLKTLNADNTSQLNRLKTMDTIFQKKFHYVDSLRRMAIEEKSYSRLNKGLLICQEFNDEIEETCKFMLIEEDALLRMREAEFELKLAKNKSSLLGLVIGLLLILVAVTVFLFRIFNQISAAKKIAESRNLALEQTKQDLLQSNESLNTLSSQFDSSLMKSNVAAFEWPDTSKEEFWLSDSMFAMLGMEKEDFVPNVSDFFSQLMHPDDVETVQKSLHEHLTKGKTYNPEYRLKKKNGQYHYFRALGSSSSEEGKKSMTGVIIDINEEVELRKSRDVMTSQLKEYALRFDLVLEGSSYGVWDWYDISIPNQWWSGTFYKLIGYDPDELESTIDSFQQLVHPDDIEKTKQAMEDNIAKGTKIKVEYRLRTKKEGYKWFRAVGDRILDELNPKQIRMIGVVSDISQEKKSSEELKRSNADLQDFAYVASHDLQEPLRKIQAFGDRLNVLVEKKYPDFEGALFVKKMYSSATRMRRLIDDLLNFSRISSESNFTENVDLNEILDDVKDLLSETLQAASATIIADELPIIKKANASNLTQLFQNLISNGVKFRKEGITPVLEIKYSKVSVNEATKISPSLNNFGFYHKFEFKDNGIGFDENYLKKIFTIFQRLHGKSEFQGTGIGLAVCQKICENHEGFITAESKEGEGATFIVLLPIRNPKK